MAATTLVLFAHPALEKSRANRALLSGIEGMENVVINDLYEHYPDFQIDVEREQRLLEEADRVIFQHPFYWYSTPSLMKEWFDVVLQYGWAYGDGGNALVGKRARTVVTTGGSKAAYCAEGHNGYPVGELLRPVEQTARLCGMDWQEPIVFYGALHLDEEGLAAAVETYRKALRTPD